MVESADLVKAFENFTLDAAGSSAGQTEEKPAQKEEAPKPKAPKKKKAPAAGGAAASI